MVSASSACCSPAIPWTEPEQYSRPRFAADRVAATRSGRSDEVLLARYRLVSVSITRILSPLKIYDLALIRLLDYIEGVGQPLAYYAGELRPPTP